MRLTLRVLLAYLDNILEPGDAKAVEAKIAESENVSTLVHHIREITKRMRISAPEVLGKGLGLDPNTVAEYLDYGLSDDGVRDFENVCMTSDVHMAEVAACHEILSLVLVKPAEIEPSTRQRMYKLLHEPQPAALRAEPVGPATPTPAVARPAAVASAVPTEPRRKSEVPDYLRQSEEAEPVAAGRNYFFLALAIAAVFIAGTIGVLGMVPYENLPEFMRPWQAAVFPSKVPDEIVEVPTKGTPSPAVAVPSSTLPGATVPLASTPTGSVLPAAANATPVAPAATTVPAPAAPAATMPASSTTAADAAAGLRQPASALTTAAVAPPASTVAPVPPVPNSVMPATAPPAPTSTTPPAPMPATTASGSPAVAVTPAVSGAPAKIEQVGRVSSDLSQVLLRYNPQQGWVRVQPRDVVVVGDRLLALPGYRPQVSLTNGLTYDLLGGTAVELLPVDATGTPGLRILRGRLMLFTVGGPNGKLLLEDGMKQVMLTLGGGAEVALEHVFRRYVGTDPAGGPLPWALVVTVKSGDVGWSARPTDQQSLKGPGQWVLTDSADLAPLAGGLPPAWMTVDERDLLEKQAADYIESALRGGKAVKVALEETVEDRRSENQQLALRCLAQLGSFDDFMPILVDPAQRYVTWDRYLGYLTEGARLGGVLRRVSLRGDDQTTRPGKGSRVISDAVELRRRATSRRDGQILGRKTRSRRSRLPTGRLLDADADHRAGDFLRPARPAAQAEGEHPQVATEVGHGADRASGAVELRHEMASPCRPRFADDVLYRRRSDIRRDVDRHGVRTLVVS
ncbi:MAG: hypothetical protein QM775_29255 [Pirellulales bacterium]